jgi:translation elongation factor EF-1alpha
MEKDTLVFVIGLLVLAGAAAGAFYYWDIGAPQLGNNMNEEDRENSIDTPGTETGAEEKNVAFTDIAKGTYGGEAKRGNHVFYNATELTAAFDAVSIPLPDFSGSMMVAVAAGTKPTGGYAIEITRIIETTNEVRVMATETSPGENCIVTQALTSPFHVVKIPRIDKEVKFTIESEIRNC